MHVRGLTVTIGFLHSAFLKQFYEEGSARKALIGFETGA